jgi:hypothetical protein
MKKTFTFCAVLVSLLGFSQSLKMYHMGPSYPVPNDTTFSYNINPGDPTINDIIDIKNTGNTTKTYKVIKRVITLNQGPITNTNSASPYFCFGGTCYGNLTYTSSAVATLTMNQSTSQIAGTYNPLSADFDESPTVKGYSYVKYTFYDINNISDSVRVGFKFNASLLGIKTNANILEYVSEVYPNPSNENASISISLKQDVDVKLQVYNCLGSLINTTSQKYAPGKNKISIDCSDLNAGIYFVSVSAGDAKMTRRLIVNK